MKTIKLIQNEYNKIINGEQLYIYRDDCFDEGSEKFVEIMETNKIVAKLELDKPIKKSSSEMIEFSEKYDDGNFKNLNKSDIFAIPINKIILINPIYKDEFENKNEAQLEEYLKENYISTIEFEQEMKILTSKDEFYRIFNKFSKGNQVLQKNHYFDNDNTLHDSHKTLRIREKSKKYTVTLKEKKSDVKELSTEKSENISKEEFEKILNNKKLKVEDYLKNTITGEYEYLGYLETLREEVPYKNVLLVFDISSYFGKTDFEIEMEGKQNDLIQVYDSFDMEKFEESGKTKQTRFLEEYERQNKNPYF